MRSGPAAGLALFVAIGPPAAVAQSPIDVRTIVSVPPQEEAPAAPPRPAVRPWDVAPGTAQPTALAAAGTAPTAPDVTEAFTGAVAALPCRPAGYRAIIDEHSDLRSGTVCRMPDGSWQLLP